MVLLSAGKTNYVIASEGTFIANALFVMGKALEFYSKRTKRSKLFWGLAQLKARLVNFTREISQKYHWEFIRKSEVIDRSKRQEYFSIRIIVSRGIKYK